LENASACAGEGHGERRRRKKRTSSAGAGLAASGHEQQARWAQARVQALGATPRGADDGGLLADASAGPVTAAAGCGKRVSIVAETEVSTRPEAARPTGDAGSDGSCFSSAAAPLVPENNREALVQAQQSERAAAREAKEEERREVLARRQQDALLMLRNIPFLEVRIIGASPVQESGASFTAYQIELAVPKDTFHKGAHTVTHRYSRFASLHEALVKAWGRHVELPKLPAKRMTLGGLSSKQIEERRIGLEQYLSQLVTVLNWSIEPNIRAFFECDRWVKERRTRPSVSSHAA